MNSIGARRWWALAALDLGVLAVGLDVTVLSVALPTLATALKASESDLQWFSAAYALVLAAGMLPAGVLGDFGGGEGVATVAPAVASTSERTGTPQEEQKRSPPESTVPQDSHCAMAALP